MAVTETHTRSRDALAEELKALVQELKEIMLRMNARIEALEKKNERSEDA